MPPKTQKGQIVFYESHIDVLRKAITAYLAIDPKNMQARYAQKLLWPHKGCRYCYQTWEEAVVAGMAEHEENLEKQRELKQTKQQNPLNEKLQSKRKPIPDWKINPPRVLGGISFPDTPPMWEVLRKALRAVLAVTPNDMYVLSANNILYPKERAALKHWWSLSYEEQLQEIKENTERSLRKSAERAMRKQSMLVQLEPQEKPRETSVLPAKKETEKTEDIADFRRTDQERIRLKPLVKKSLQERIAEIQSKDMAKKQR